MSSEQRPAVMSEPDVLQRRQQAKRTAWILLACVAGVYLLGFWLKR